MLLHIVHHHIRLQVVHLDAVPVVGMKRLLGFVDRKSDVFARRMPRRIHQRRDGFGRFGIQFFNLPAIHDHRTRIGGTHVEQHLFGILHTERVAVHTVIVGHLILVDSGLAVGCQFALVDAHLVP